MVARSAYAQLRYSPLLLAGTVAGLALIYLAPVAARPVRPRLRRRPRAAWPGLLMAIAFQPMLRFYRCRHFGGLVLPAIALAYMAFTLDSAYQHARGPRRPLEGPGSGQRDRDADDECRRPAIRQRPPGREFSRRVVADSARATARRSSPSTSSSAPPTTSPTTRSSPRRQKLEVLDRLEADLLGRATAIASRSARCAPCSPSAGCRRATPRTCSRRSGSTPPSCATTNWDDLIGYCAYSAMPVGRYVLDVHGESRSTWPASDAICAALQIINHLQDCAKDYRNLNRVYVPLDALAAAGTSVEALGAAKASPELHALHRRACETHRGAAATRATCLLCMVEDRRLGLEISVIRGDGRPHRGLADRRAIRSARTCISASRRRRHRASSRCSRACCAASGRRPQRRRSAGE